MKWLGLLIVALLLGGSWVLFQRNGDKIQDLDKRMEMLRELEDPDEQIPQLQGEIQNAEGQRTFMGIMLVISGAVFVGILFVAFVLPNWVGRMAEGIYGSGAGLESTPTHAALSLVAQGDYEGAIAAFREVAAAEPSNRSPWVEISKIQRKQLEDPQAAAATLREGMDSFDWPADDKAFFLFRLADIHHDDFGNKEEAALLLRRVIRDLPDTRHAMNAANTLKDWGMA